ncbi:hypothetical protein GTY65_24450 [Streptomyces sp. SID8379]|uniref:hypothetical protein n=1 Tax=unclassified Streptomyces TaxID=2593676 RepID=UPI000368866D|nr:MULTISPECIES: hypothetical protein [unclassified Streptomyces]MYW67194.1 hypothetical protein [Streptomyces sp. SID8379]
MFTLDAFCHTAPLPAPTAAPVKPLRVVGEISDRRFLPADVDMAVMRFVRAQDVRRGDLVIGTLSNTSLAVGDARMGALPYPFVADGAVPLEDRSCSCYMCVPDTAGVTDYQGLNRLVHLGKFVVTDGNEPNVHCAVSRASQFMCVIPALRPGYSFTLADTGEQRTMSPRPQHETFEALPYGLTLDDAVAVRAHQVAAGDVVCATFGNGTRQSPPAHVPAPYEANPHTMAECPCEGCDECDDMESWTLAAPERVADLGWRFVCLAPAEDGEPCEIWPRERPVVVLRADVVESARMAAEEAQRAEEAPVRTFGVTWTADFEASTPEEAAQLAYEQLKSYADADAWAPVLVVEDEGGTSTTIDLHGDEQAEADR